MGKAYLLTGKPKVGKTTALKAIISVIGLKHCAGFYTEEVRTYGNRTGFRIVTLDGQAGMVADVNSKSSIRVGKYGVNLTSLETIAIQAIYEAITNRDFVIVDEIGPMQLYSDKFKQAILDVMSSSKSLLGTIVLRSSPWVDKFKRHRNVEIYQLTPDNRNDRAKMLSWLYKELK